jgi:hypothetical protein
MLMPSTAFFGHPLIAQVAFDEFHATCLHVVFQIFQPSAANIVDDPNVRAASEQRIHQGRADKGGTASPVTSTLRPFQFMESPSFWFCRTSSVPGALEPRPTRPLESSPSIASTSDPALAAAGTATPDPSFASTEAHG